MSVMDIETFFPLCIIYYNIIFCDIMIYLYIIFLHAKLKMHRRQRYH